jgi:soluble lytic murein transglycosylase-like protein
MPLFCSKFGASRRFGTVFLAMCAAAAMGATTARALESVTLRNGYDLVCDHRQAQGETTRLYLDTGTANYIDVATSQIEAVETVQTLPTLPALPASPAAVPAALPGTPAASVRAAVAPPLPEVLSGSELRQVLAGAGHTHDLDIDLLASVVHAESAGHVHACSHVGAEGLMQLMPGTAAQLGVQDAFEPSQNVNAGTAYLDALLHRYHDNLAFALAAYNAGPAAVERWHGIPPYPETRAYVARIIHEFNQKYLARLQAAEAARRRLSASLSPSGNRP